MESTGVLVGIAGLQITIVAGLTAVIEQLAPAAEGIWVILMWIGVLITLSGFFVDRLSLE